MTPTKVKTGSSKGSNRRNTKPSSSGSSSKNKKRSSIPQAARREIKTKRTDTRPAKKKQREYRENELDIPKLNMVAPAGVQKPKGKKKGKVFVDDPESMMTILAMVNADKEGQIESRMMKARQMEEIREARQREMEAREAEKKAKLEATKNSLRRKRKRKLDPNGIAKDDVTLEPLPSQGGKKKVAFE